MIIEEYSGFILKRKCRQQPSPICSTKSWKKLTKDIYLEHMLANKHKMMKLWQLTISIRRRHQFLHNTHNCASSWSNNISQ